MPTRDGSLARPSQGPTRAASSASRSRPSATGGADRPAGAALAAGDVEAARIAHETIGRLLGAPGADAAGVIDLAAERVRRGG
ncbi:hypothetical protein predicted by Glimmer/Critica [Sorangium cellulosum So ce56]|uniref:Uncharacterized protein n=1 Tax=Sorangium cellulosum (strain So ce56) TaxID=448385 RepID=A9GJM0_SORC5|nr:hypothetical protein predicted by Glimmer/Critica [Sorangium cellulosum So ce56]